MENKDKEIHIWHDNSGSDNYDLFFDIEDPNETAPSVLLLHCHEDEANYRERWQMELAGTSFVQQLVDAERDRATARENQIENTLDTCCNEVKGRLDTAESNITQNQTNIQHLQTDVNNIQGDVTNLHNTVNALDGRVSTNETNIANLQRDVQNAQSTANAANTAAQQAQQTADGASTIAQQAQSTANTANNNAQQAQNTANDANTTAQQAQQTANAVSSTANNANTTAQQTQAELNNLQSQVNQSVSDLQTQIQNQISVWNYIPYFYSFSETVDGVHMTTWYDLTSWINSFPTPSQIEDKLKTGHYRLFINYIQDSGKPLTAYVNGYNYDETTKRLSVEYSSTGHATFGMTLMTT